MSAAAAAFDADHPVIKAQQVVNSIIDSQQSEFGIYADAPQGRLNVLSDIRAIAGRILAYATPEELDSIVPADLLAAYRNAADTERVTFGPAKADTKPGLAAPAHAAIAAVGVTAALRTLTAPTIAEAGHTLRWLISSSRGRGQAVTATNIGWGKNTTPTLAGAQLEALAPMLKPSDHLRYRIGSTRPAPPASTKKDAADLARRLPTMLWAPWSLRLALPNCHQRQLRPALSPALLVVGCRINLSDAAALTGSPISGHAVSRILQLLEHRSDWPGTRSALFGMADYVVDGTVPIDYDRRRNLDYTDLLPTSVWNTICRDTETRHMQRGAAAVARCFLFERITGLPAGAAPFGKNDSAFRTTLADFPRRLTPDLLCELDRHAHAYLAEHGAAGEPATWYPPDDPLDGLNLPGPDPSAVDVAALHHALRVNDQQLGVAAQQLGTTLDVVRFVLEVHPAAPKPAVDQSPVSERSPGASYLCAKQVLQPERFVDLYQRQRLSLSEIGATIGVSRQTVSRLARDYAIPLREPKPYVRQTLDRDWLYEQYVAKRRTISDIADEVGMSPASVFRWISTYEIPTRARGGPSHRANLAAQDIAATGPELIRPALAGIGGWDRLQRFEVASRHPTIAAAANDLGIAQSTLVTQIGRIERELGVTLLYRTDGARPMTPTEAGARVAATIRACAQQGWR